MPHLVFVRFSTLQLYGGSGCKSLFRERIPLEARILCALLQQKALDDKSVTELMLSALPGDEDCDTFRHVALHRPGQSPKTSGSTPALIGSPTTKA